MLCGRDLPHLYHIAKWSPEDFVQPRELDMTSWHAKLKMQHPNYPQQFLLFYYNKLALGDSRI